MAMKNGGNTTAKETKYVQYFPMATMRLKLGMSTTPMGTKSMRKLPMAMKNGGMAMEI